MQDYDAKLGIYSNPSILTEKLITKFQDKYLEVTVFSNSSEIDLTKLSYLVINLIGEVGGLSVNNINMIKSFVDGLECKIIVLFPLYVKNETRYISETNLENLLEINKNTGLILVPEILGSGVKFNLDYLSHNLIMQSLVSERIKIKDSGILINTISLNKLVERVVKETFSFGIAGQKLALVGPKKGIKIFLTKYLKIDEANIIVVKGENNYSEINHTLTSKVDFSLKFAVNATLTTFLAKVKDENVGLITTKRQILEPKEEARRLIPVGRSLKKIFLSRLFTLFLSLIAILIVPFFVLVVSLILFYLSTKFVLTNAALSEKLINYSANTVAISQKINFGIPFYYNYSNITSKTIFIFSEVFELSKVGSGLASKIMGDEPYDLTTYSDNISAILDRIHTDVGFLQSDLNDLTDFLGRNINQYLTNKKVDIGQYKGKVYFLKNFMSRLSTLLGVDKPMKYLVLFQNNMELRPTGGFIGSYAIMTFDKGRLTEVVVNDVYSADGQLKGHVDPPEPIRQYLGEGGWYMRDANWDPSFPESAEKIEWFLEKETNVSVDGVFAIDLNFIQSLLRITGPLELTDFDKTISADNLYTTTQQEVESDFFPGSTKKASFLTSLSRKLITELETLPSDKYFLLLKEFYRQLEERHLQLFFHDFNTQESINNLNYSGFIDMNTDCGLRCFNDSYSVVDANLGVNKANFFINRFQAINLFVTKSFITHELFITYQNTANQAVGNSGIYKSYTRLLLPLKARVTGVRLYDTNGNFEDLRFDKTDLTGRQEIGFLINVLPSDSKRVQIVWNIDTNALINGGEYKLLIRKQAGTDIDPLSVNIEKTDLSLTGGASAVYTTSLVRDFSTRLFFKP